MQNTDLQHKYRGWLRLIQLSLFFLFLVSALPLSAQEDTPEIRQPFGITDAYWRANKAAELNLSWETIVFDWAKIQPNGPGDFAIDEVFDEAWLTDAQTHNREIVGVIINTPQWASMSGEPYAVPDGLYTPYDNPENLWAVFLNQFIPYMAEQGIHTWLIWEAPDDFTGNMDIRPHFAGSVQDYYRLLKIAYQTIKSQDESAQVFVGGLVGWVDVALTREVFLQQLINLALNDPQAERNNYFFDGVLLDIALSGDPFAGVVQTSDSAGDFVTQNRIVLNEAGLTDKPIWVQLSISPTADPIGGLANLPIQITPEQQADFVVHGSALALSAGAERVSIYKLYDSKFVENETVPAGLIRHDNTERPAFASYRFVTNTMAPLYQASTGRSQNGRLVVIEKPTETVYVTWAFGTKSVDFWIPAIFDDRIIHYNKYGDPLPEPRQGIGIDGLPVYVISAPGTDLASDGQVRVSGEPHILVVEGEPRSVWAAIEGTAVQIFVASDS